MGTSTRVPRSAQARTTSISPSVRTPWRTGPTTAGSTPAARRYTRGSNEPTTSRAYRSTSSRSVRRLSSSDMEPTRRARSRHSSSLASSERLWSPFSMRRTSSKAASLRTYSSAASPPRAALRSLSSHTRRTTSARIASRSRLNPKSRCSASFTLRCTGASYSLATSRQSSVAPTAPMGITTRLTRGTRAPAAMAAPRPQVSARWRLRNSFF